MRQRLSQAVFGGSGENRRAAAARRPMARSSEPRVYSGAWKELEELPLDELGAGGCGAVRWWPIRLKFIFYF